MYVEFNVTNWLHLMQIRSAVDSWQQQHGVVVRQKTVKNIHRVGLDDESQWVLFMLTWRGPEFRVIHSRNH